MKRITKRAKAVDVIWHRSVCYVSSYTCPSCKTSFSGFVGGRNTTRFVCKCGQELIITSSKEE